MHSSSIIESTTKTGLLKQVFPESYMNLMFHFAGDSGSVATVTQQKTRDNKTPDIAFQIYDQFFLNKI